MNVIEGVAVAARKIGYRNEAIVTNYLFADVLAPSAPTRTVALAAFTQTPPSYRSAAFALVTNSNQATLELVQAYRALGAPLLFVVDGDDVTLWQVRTAVPSRLLERLTVAELPALFERNSDAWRPDVLHRAKSIGAVESEYQLDFVDAGLLPAIEGEIHTKLDRLLVEALSAANATRRKPDGVDTRLLFRVVFRLLAAKVLQDRGHSFAATWNPDDLPSVVQGIESYYGLDRVLGVSHGRMPVAFSAAWNCLRRGINFSNISADDLAFVYENTLVTPQTRQLFGTHSTPRQVAEYIVQRLELYRHRPESIRIYEPFAGAAVFLVSALRHLRDLLPMDWTDQERHNFLIDRLAGDEAEPFACEVAKLSLILADYPNHNGWKIKEIDLFEDRVLDMRIKGHNIILCNPPFEAFSANERKRYPIAQLEQSKSVAVLNSVLDAHPLALGFVLPRPFIVEGQFATQRKRLERLYENIEIVELPDRTFNASSIEAALLVARERRAPDSITIKICSTEIADQDRIKFLKTGDITTKRTMERTIQDKPTGQLWIPPLSDLWDYLDECQKLNSIFDLHLGARWKYDQIDAVSTVRKRGFRPGLFNADDVRQFGIEKVSFIDLEPSNLTHALNRDWGSAKIIANAVRLSRGPWRLAACVDRNGLAFSQQLLGLWPKPGLSTVSLEAYAAVLNGPIASAYFATRYPSHRFRLSSFGELPVPRRLSSNLGDLVSEYITVTSNSELIRSDNQRASELLTYIDAMVLDAYDLPLRLERQLLELFRGADRPVVHRWTHWNEYNAVPGLTLSERLSGRFRPQEKWITKVFSPLPEDEVELLRQYGEWS